MAEEALCWVVVALYSVVDVHQFELCKFGATTYGRRQIGISHGTPTVETYHPRGKHFNLHEYLQDGDIKRWTMWPQKSQQRLTIVIGLNKL
jgi:hypothetical protein